MGSMGAIGTGIEGAGAGAGGGGGSGGNELGRTVTGSDRGHGVEGSMRSGWKLTGLTTTVGAPGEILVEELVNTFVTENVFPRR